MLNPNLDEVQLSKDDYERYSRHIILPQVGVDGQKKLKAASVLCVGTGGLGSPVLLYLAAAGIGRIGIVDFDIVDTSNLQRQVIHSTSGVGKAKIVSAKERILEINPFCQIDLYETRITAENALDIIRPYDVVVDGTDNFPTRYLVNDACVILDKPNVYGSIFHFEGQATVFNHKGGWVRTEGWDALTPAEKTAARKAGKDWNYDQNAPSPNYRDLYPEPPPPGLVPSCAEGGVLGILCGVIGTLQATEVVKIILGVGTTLSGRLMLYDALNMKFRELKLNVNPDRPVINGLIDYDDFCGVTKANAEEQAAKANMPEMTVTDLKALIDSGATDYVLVDVRNPHEFDIGKIPGGILIPLPDIENADGVEQVKKMLGDKKLIVHCKAGGRSAKAIAILKEKAGIQGTNVIGGILAWSKDVDPSVPEY